MQVIKTDVFTIDELSDSAKQNAREWWVNLMGTEDYAEYVISDALEILERLGVQVKTHPVRLYGGGERSEPCIWWSGFSCQGDGASFEGLYRSTGTALTRVKEHAPVDAKLHEIAQELDEAHALLPTTVAITTHGNYCHSGTMQFEMDYEGSFEDHAAEVDRRITSALRSFADWIYHQLEKEYEYQASDEQVDETLRCNEYTFTEEGKRFG
jgi:hypothetical protein